MYVCIWERVMVAHLGLQGYKQMHIDCRIVCRFPIHWRMFCTLDCHIGNSTISIVSELSKGLVKKRIGEFNFWDLSGNE